MNFSGDDKRVIYFSKEYGVSHIERTTFSYFMRFFMSDFDNLKEVELKPVVKINYQELSDLLDVTRNHCTKIIRALKQKELIHILGSGNIRYITLTQKALFSLSEKQNNFLRNKLQKFSDIVKMAKNKISNKAKYLKEIPLVKETAKLLNIDLDKKAEEIVEKEEKAINKAINNNIKKDYSDSKTYQDLQEERFTKEHYGVLNEAKSKLNEPFFRLFHLNKIIGVETAYYPHTTVEFRDFEKANGDISTLLVNSLSKEPLAKKDTNAIISLLVAKKELMYDKISISDYNGFNINVNLIGFNKTMNTEIDENMSFSIEVTDTVIKFTNDMYKFGLKINTTAQIENVLNSLATGSLTMNINNVQKFS